MMAAELILWAQAYDRKIKAAEAEEERIEWAFRHALKQEIVDNEVDDYLKRLFAAWFFHAHQEMQQTRIIHTKNVTKIVFIVPIPFHGYCLIAITLLVYKPVDKILVEYDHGDSQEVIGEEARK